MFAVYVMLYVMLSHFTSPIEQCLDPTTFCLILVNGIPWSVIWIVIIPKSNCFKIPFPSLQGGTPITPSMISRRHFRYIYTVYGGFIYIGLH